MDVTQWLSIGQAARALGVRPQTVDVYCWKGKLTYLRTPLGRLIDPASVERLAKEREARRKGVGGE